MSTTAGQAALPRALKLTLAFAGVLLGLLCSVILTGQASPKDQPAAPTTPLFGKSGTPMMPNDSPLGVHVVLLDRASRPPQLRGTWQIYVLPGAQDLYLQGLPYDLVCASAGGSGTRLDSAYRTPGNDERQGDAVLRALVQRVFPAQLIDYQIVLDAHALDEWAALLAPIDLSPAAPGTPPSAWWYDPASSEATLARQEQILAGLLTGIYRVGPDTASGPLYQSIQHSGRTDMPPEEFHRFLTYLDVSSTGNAHRSFLHLDTTREYCQP